MTAWHAAPLSDVRTELETGPEGLTRQEAEARRAEHGPNALPTPERPAWWRVLGRQFASPMIAFLGLCALVTAIEREWVDTAAIVLVLVLNAAVGFWQERKAESDVLALQSMTTTTARVVREGAVGETDAIELVPGDVVVLESGDMVPADLRLSDVNGLRIDESMLTGEAEPVGKRNDAADTSTVLAERTSMAYSGSHVVAGRGRGVVVATGESTEIGEINTLVQGPVGKTPLQVLTSRLERTIGAVVLGTAVAIFAAALLLGHPVSETFRTAVALVVSAMPEALPVVLTVSMGFGVSQMARRRAVVRRLPSVETLGSTTVIGSDKTGTLTQNLLTVEQVWTAAGTVTGEDLESVGDDAAQELVRRALLAGVLTNEARPDRDARTGFAGDAVDVAMMVAAHRAGLLDDDHLGEVLADMPYEPDLGYSQTVRRHGERTVLYVKGAPEKVLSYSSRLAVAEEVDGAADGESVGTVDLEDTRTAEVEEAGEVLAQGGLRVIATASRAVDAEEAEALADLDHAHWPTPSDLTLLGMEAMVDPPRQGVPEAVEACRAAGIHVMMITGDNPVTARAIGGRLGLDTGAEPVTGSQMAGLDDAALTQRLEETSIAARMTPQDKLRIVEVLQARGETVAVTGDGVNDAPALRAASIGVAMGESGTDVAREASDVVLTDDNFVTIVDAVEQGRITFATIRKATFFLLSSAVGTMVAVAVNTFTDHPLIFLPVMLLWMNIVTNGVQDVALSFEPGEGDELERPVRSRDEGILDSLMWMRTAVTGVVMAVLTLVVYGRALDAGLEVEHARTLALTTMVMANFFQIVNARTERRSVFTVNPLRNPFLVVASLGALVLHAGVMAWPVSAGILGLVPLSAAEWLMCAGMGAVLLAVVELDKALLRRRTRLDTSAAAP